MNQREYYYWNKDYQNDKGETLDDCFRKYGTGVQHFKLGGYNVAMECVFLGEKCDFGYSWCMKCYQIETGTNMPVGLYEKNPNDKIYGHHDLNPISVSANKHEKKPAKAA